jgi:hypothetical protein
MFSPYKDYSSLLIGKLTEFTFCNYDFEIILTYFVVYDAYFIICVFFRDIRMVSAYFVSYDLFWLFMISCR